MNIKDPSNGDLSGYSPDKYRCWPSSSENAQTARSDLEAGDSALVGFGRVPGGYTLPLNLSYKSDEPETFN